MPWLADRVQEQASAPGTGPVTLTGAVQGFRTFAAAYGTQDLFPYTITDGTAWETGLGFLSSSTVLVRDTVEASSNNGAAVNFTGTVRAFVTPVAGTLPRSVPGMSIGLRSLTRF